MEPVNWKLLRDFTASGTRQSPVLGCCCDSAQCQYASHQLHFILVGSGSWNLITTLCALDGNAVPTLPVLDPPLQAATDAVRRRHSRLRLAAKSWSPWYTFARWRKGFICVC